MQFRSQIYQIVDGVFVRINCTLKRIWLGSKSYSSDVKNTPNEGESIVLFVKKMFILNLLSILFFPLKGTPVSSNVSSDAVVLSPTDVLLYIQMYHLDFCCVPALCLPLHFYMSKFLVLGIHCSGKVILVSSLCYSAFKHVDRLLLNA